ncbi:MAG TPA: adenylate/guanylate cyclase domain-containing protein [Kofleriaceae bacterium]|jgi:adenylate cyclase|nr:adenylate/guanylate cyclase domain-containing protein [Kofleriaceae bacterium]
MRSPFTRESSNVGDRMTRRLTLGQVFYLSILALAVVLGALGYVLFAESRRAIIDSAASLRTSASLRVQARIEGHLAEAEAAVAELERRLAAGDCAPGDPVAVESCLYAGAAANANLSEVTFTAARRVGFTAQGAPVLAPEGRWQVSVFRETAARDTRICTRRTEPGAAGGFAATTRCRAPERVLLDAPAAPTPAEIRSPVPATADDPTQHPTFQTPASRAVAAGLVWTDLSYAELDLARPADQRRVVVTVMKALETPGASGASGGPGGELVGVARVGLLATHLDQEIAGIRVNPEPDDPFRIFVCDDDGRFVTRLAPDDPLTVSGDDLRVAPRAVPPAIAAAVHHDALVRAADAPGGAGGTLELDGARYAVAFQRLAHTQGWYVGIVGPEDYYLSALRGTVHRLVALSGAVIALILGAGLLTLRMLRRGLGQITHQADRIHAFDFAPASPDARFRDVAAVLESVEQAKTAMRAMRKYVPIDLVKQLFEANREPTLGGRLEDVSLMFTDVLGFTSIAETVEPERMARLLGRYFEAMTAAVHDADGTIDKYIGDAVMAIWNAPRPCTDHAILACRAVLGCLERTRALFASDAWEGLAPLHTRYGLHRDRVVVGHFGAPDRLSFTAIGDGVNLAARLEALNKFYGTTVLVSGAIERDARGVFAFRRVDRVAVKGKTIPVELYELIGVAGADPAREAIARDYERAFEAYLAREFDAALAVLAALGADGPSQVLAERCRALRASPPPPEWDGRFIATTK